MYINGREITNVELKVLRVSILISNIITNNIFLPIIIVSTSYLPLRNNSNLFTVVTIIKISALCMQRTVKGFIYVHLSLYVCIVFIW